jgi:ankyrin repeat protein
MEMRPADLVIAAVLEGDEARVADLVGRDHEVVLARNMFGATPLHAAHYTGRDDLLASFVWQGAIDFALCAELGRVDTIRDDLAVHPERARQFGESGSTPLHGACYWGQVDVARVLLDAGADSTAITRDSFLRIAPLGAAVATTPGIPQPSDDEEVVLALVRLLLERGADPNQPRGDGMTPLHGAAWRGLRHVVQELIDAGADRTLAAVSGPHAGQTAADTAVTQGHFALAAALDSGTDDVASPYG